MYLISIVALPPKLNQPPLLLKPRIRVPRQTIPRDIDIRMNILDQTLKTDIIILRANEPQNNKVHVRAVEILLELVHDVHLDAAHTVLVERVPADAHDHGEDGGLVARGGRGREARPAVVDAGGNVVVAADGEA